MGDNFRIKSFSKVESGQLARSHTWSEVATLSATLTTTRAPSTPPAPRATRHNTAEDDTHSLLPAAVDPKRREIV